MSAQLLTA